MKNWDVFVFGDINVDLLVPGARMIPPAGAEWEIPLMETAAGGGAALFALGLAKLGMRPAFFGRVGGDLYGRYLVDCLEKAGVDTSLLEVFPRKKTGVSISFTDSRDRSFLTFRGGCPAPEPAEVPLASVARARHIHLTGYAGAENHAAYLAFLRALRRETDVTVSFDVGWDASGAWDRCIYELFPYLDILFMNETECLHYSKKASAEEAAREFAACGCMAVIKLGKKGSLCCRDGCIATRKGFFVNAVDTTGAGDSFNAGFVYGFLNGETPEGALMLGNGCGALSCTEYGGNTGFPTRDRLTEFIREQNKEDTSR